MSPNLNLYLIKLIGLVLVLLGIEFIIYPIKYMFILDLSILDFIHRNYLPWIVLTAGLLFFFYSPIKLLEKFNRKTQEYQDSFNTDYNVASESVGIGGGGCLLYFIGLISLPIVLLFDVDWTTRIILLFIPLFFFYAPYSSRYIKRAEQAFQETDRFTNLMNEGDDASRGMISSKGYVYILINPSMKDLVKIGKTTRDSETRATELSKGTGIPSDFIVAYEEQVSNCDEVERIVHDRLASFRVNKNREFFRVPLKIAVQTVKEVTDQIKSNR